MGALGVVAQHQDVERDDKAALLAELQRPDPGRAAAITQRLHTNLLPIFLLMATLCYIDRCAARVC